MKKSAALDRIFRQPVPVREDLARFFAQLSQELLEADPPKTERHAQLVRLVQVEDALDRSGLRGKEREDAACVRLGGISRSEYYRRKKEAHAEDLFTKVLQVS